MLFVDMEWEHAHNSTGAPVSIGVVHEDGRGWYAQWHIERASASGWTALQVLPRLRDGVYAPVDCPYTDLVEVLSVLQSYDGQIWASEEAAFRWLLLMDIKSSLFPGKISEHETQQLWWSQQQWQESNGAYHAWTDALGMREGAIRMGWLK